MWFGGKQMPSICKECIESWHKVLPSDWSFQFWNEDNYDVETKNNFVLQAYRSGNFAFVSDYVRWEAQGGASERKSEIGGALQKSQIMFHVVNPTNIPK